jgi:anti-sigma B factor antagonist
MILTVTTKQIPPDVSVLELNGRIILGNNSRDVELKLAELLRERSRKIIFDMQGVTALDSTGIGILVVCQGKINKEGGTLHVSGAAGAVEDTMRITSVDKLLKLFPSVSAAAAAFPA